MAGEGGAQGAPSRTAPRIPLTPPDTQPVPDFMSSNALFFVLWEALGTEASISFKFRKGGQRVALEHRRGGGVREKAEGAAQEAARRLRPTCVAL